MKCLDAHARGVFLITVTPFTAEGGLDLASTDSHGRFRLDCGVTGLTVLGIMGEATKLTAEESRTFVGRVLARVAGRVPVVVGASAPGFAPMRELTDSVMALGAAGVMVAPPPTRAHRRPDRRLLRHGAGHPRRRSALGSAGPSGRDRRADVGGGDPAHHRRTRRPA